MLQQAFTAQMVQFGAPQAKAEQYWQEIEAAYTAKERHFHNLRHLQHLWNELQPLQKMFQDWPTVLFALCYHDIVYDVEQNAITGDNEERSAAIADKHLQAIQYPAEKIEVCKRLILSTKKHIPGTNQDMDLFTDADLCILGQPWKVYLEYFKNIRREYDFYPDTIFKAGRKKVLEHFLQMKPLFKTDHFQKLYEEAAKENLAAELTMLKLI